MAGLPDGDRALIEDAVKLLLSEAPVGWTQLHAEFAPASQPPVAAAYVMTSAGSLPLPVSAGTLSVVAEQHRRAAQAGMSWQRLVLDCHADGRLSACTDTDATGPAALVPAHGKMRRAWQRRLRRVFMTVTLVCFAAAAVVFAVGWRWSPPPRVAMIAVPSPPPRQQESFGLLMRWFDAENRSDTAALRMMMCTNPSERLTAMVTTFEHRGNDQRLVFPEAIMDFHDEGSEVSVKIAERLRPLSEHAKRGFEAAHGAFFYNNATLVDEGGVLRMCDYDLMPG
ncbi:hypothetical protein ACAG26_07745 [Mycobacterium sp. pUA109]|uniref:hypothetical protein n=1 Tax=Mycobacterium sp. pUA109 TaxID=3238982 RepID=UPI00351B7713